MHGVTKYTRAGYELELRASRRASRRRARGAVTRETPTPTAVAPPLDADRARVRDDFGTTRSRDARDARDARGMTRATGRARASEDDATTTRGTYGATRTSRGSASDDARDDARRRGTTRARRWRAAGACACLALAIGTCGTGEGGAIERWGEATRALGARAWTKGVGAALGEGSVSSTVTSSVTSTVNGGTPSPPPPSPPPNPPPKPPPPSPPPNPPPNPPPTATPDAHPSSTPVESPSPAPEPVSSPPALTPDQAAKLKRDIRRLTRKIGRRENDHPSMPGLQQQLAELQRELNGEASPTSSVSARLGSKASIVVSTRDLDVSRTSLFCVVAVTIVGIVIRRLRRAPEFETDEIARLL